MGERGAWRPRLLVDFDGVIHRYSQGWADGSIYDPPVEGCFAALDAVIEAGYEVVVFSTRDAEQIRVWLKERWWRVQLRPDELIITDRKLPAVAIIDDRAIHFQSWWQALTDLEDRYPIPD